MANNGLRTFDDIIDYLSYLERKYAQIEKKLSELKIGFFSADKKKLKAKKAKMEAELDRISDTYDYYDKLFSESTTFARKDLSSFLTKYFALVYGKTYEVQREVYDTSESKYAKTCDFIASSEDFSRIDKKYDLTKQVNMDKVMELCKDDCICLGGTKTHVLLADSEMHSDFSAFPEIIEAAKKLINVKLSHPNLTDKERLDYVLKEMATDIELKRQESLLGANVTKATSQEQPRINIVGRSSQPVQKPRVEPSASTSKRTAPVAFASEDWDKALIDSLASVFSNIQNQAEVEKAAQAKSQRTVSVEPESASVEPKPVDSGEKKLTKSMMGIYMNRK